MSKIFRKEVLEKLQSPDRLNEMVKITSSKSWLALAGIAGILISMLVWGFFGKIPKSIEGRGILIQHGGVVEVASGGSGAIRNIIKREGDEVHMDEVVAYLHLPALQMQIANTKDKLEDLQTYLAELESFGDKDLTMRKDLIAKKRAIQLDKIASNDTLIAFYEKKIKQEEELRKDGLITEETQMKTRDAYLKLQQKNDALESELQSISISMFETEQYRNSEEQEMELMIAETERKLDELDALLELKGSIKSPVDGKVIELLANTGNQITIGEVIMKVEHSSKGERLEAITYVGSVEGKRILKDMKVKLSPSTVEVEEFGFIWGTVTYVSEYPSSYQGILRVLGNERLVESFISKEGPPLAVRISLDLDPESHSGFKWTSGKGPNIKIRTGTMCQTKIEVDESRPVEILFVKFNKLRNVERW